MLNNLLKTIILKPRLTLAALAVAVTVTLGLTMGLLLERANGARWEARALVAEATVKSQSDSIQMVADMSAARATLAEKAIRLADEAGKADRSAAKRYLEMASRPPSADLCDQARAAQALIDNEVKENRQ